MADDLRSLRAQLTACDEQIVTLLGERMRLIRRVADVKAAAGLPSFDREREGAHMDDLHARAAMAGVPAEVLRDVYGTLFAASRDAQREALHAGDERFSIGIIGGTSGMGAFLARLFTRAGYAVETTGVIAISAGGPGETRHIGASNADLASRHDLVIVAVPISVTVDVIREIAPHVRAGACLCDVTSVKRAPLEAMLQHAPETVDVVGTHPMFGPSGDDMDRQRVVLCRGRGSAGESRVRRLFESFGAEIIEATAEEHDAQMALIQVLVHEKTMVLGSVMERLKADLPRSLQFASPIYRIELATIGRMFSQRAELYADILTANPEGAAVSHLFEQEAAHFSRAVAMHDRETMLKRFHEIAHFMTEFAAWAKKESDAILHDIVRHG
jgi:chorismate mutase/prephenate dehydrogenase